MTAPADPAMLAALDAAALTTVEGAFAYAGGDDLVKAGLGHRRRTRIKLDSPAGPRVVYLKRYEVESLSARLRRRWTYGRGRSAAAVEYDNIRLARKAGVATMTEIHFGQERCGGDFGRSFIVVTAVPGDALSRCDEQVLAAGESAGRDLAVKLSELVRTLHAAGLVHRDLYACHVFADLSGGRLTLNLIDLARMFAPRWRRFRWRVKDLAQLRFSMPAEWVGRWWGEFMDVYLAGCGEGESARYNRAVTRKAESIRRGELHRLAAGTREGNL